VVLVQAIIVTFFLCILLWDEVQKRMKHARVESAHGGYLAALEYVRKRLCPWCKLGVGVAKTRHAGPWKHGAAKNEGCRASWVIDYEWEYREAARKQGTPK
jgi:hypothetical protein